MISINKIKQEIQGGYITMFNNKIYSVENQNIEKNKHLYIMSLSDSDKKQYTKIGIAKDVHSRFSQLQQKVEYEIILDYKKYLPNTYIIEQAIKNSLKEFNIKHYTFGKIKKKKIELPNYTEWFCIDKETKSKVKSFLQNISVVELDYEYSENKIKHNIEKHRTKYRVASLNNKKEYRLRSNQITILKELYEKTNSLWESNFIFSLIDSFNLNKPISKKQIKVLRKIYMKYERSK